MVIRNNFKSKQIIVFILFFVVNSNDKVNIDKLKSVIYIFKYLLVVMLYMHEMNTFSSTVCVCPFV